MLSTAYANSLENGAVDVFNGIEGLNHMATSLVPGIYDPSLANERLRISTETAYRAAQQLAREEGLFVGPSSGAALAAALAVEKNLRRGVIVTVFPDGGEKYLSRIPQKEE